MNKSIITVLLPTLLAACASHDSPELPAAASCELVVSVNPGVSIDISRGDQIWGDPYPEEPGLPEESRIERMQLYLETSTGQTITLSGSAAGKDGRYEFRTKVNLNSPYIEQSADGEYTISGRIAAVANYPASALPDKPFDNLPFDIESIKTSRRIPMWGVMSLDKLRLMPDATVKAGTISLLRALPKISISLDKKIQDIYKITEITADQSDYSKSAFCEPKDAKTARSTLNLLQEGCFNPNDNLTGDIVDFLWSGTGSAFTYVAERGNDKTRGPLSFTVVIERKDGTGQPIRGKVYLCDYDRGTPITDSAFAKLVRNHEYRYVISLTPIQFEISFEQWIFGGMTHIQIK